MKKSTQLAAIIAGILIGTGVTMANQNLSTGSASLVLEPGPLAADDLLKTLDIVSTQGTLGEEGEFRVVDGRVSVLKPFVYKLTNPKPGRIVSHGEKSHFYLVEFRFTLHPPETKRRYQEMKLEVKLSNSKVTTLELLPNRVNTEADVNQTFDIGFSIALPETQTSVEAKMGQTVNFKRQLPIITAFNESDSDFYWIYSKPPGANTVEPGSRIVAAVIQVPDNSPPLSATIQWKVKLERRFLGDWRDVVVSVEPITIPLL
ncbi:MAG: hypothetical protein BWK78_03045 [Thiotrichaceae bacterium IS1]|nr:MAG: hypothetical protein BWK78_03045 [Thiotrichaceae bacterium IS1]